MNCILNLLLLILIVNYSHGRSLASWSTTTDQSMIEECLQKALSHTQADGTDYNDLKTKVTNIICQTQILNGINIKLNFDLQDVRWECTFYASFVKTLGIQYEKCNQIEKENSPDEADQGVEEKESLPEEEDDEANIDTANKRLRENEAPVKADDAEDSDNDNTNQQNANDNNANQNSNAEQNADDDDNEVVVETKTDVDDTQQEQKEDEKAPEENENNRIEPDE